MSSTRTARSSATAVSGPKGREGTRAVAMGSVPGDSSGSLPEGAV